MSDERDDEGRGDYGEPWTEGRECAFTGGHAILGHMRQTARIHLSRAVTCVNACAGMKDPAAEIAALRETVKDQEQCLADSRRLARELDLAWNGGDAAEAPALVDVVAQITRELPRLRETAEARADAMARTCHVVRVLTENQFHAEVYDGVWHIHRAHGDEEMIAEDPSLEKAIDAARAASGEKGESDD